MRKIIKYVIIMVCFSVLLSGCDSSKKDPTPIVKSIEIADGETLDKLSIEDGIIQLNDTNRITVEGKGRYTKIDFFIEPIDDFANYENKENVLEIIPIIIEDNYSKQIKIGTIFAPESKDNGVDEHSREYSNAITWQLDNEFQGYVWAIIYNDNIACTTNTEKLLLKVAYK